MVDDFPSSVTSYVLFARHHCERKPMRSGGGRGFSKVGCVTCSDVSTPFKHRSGVNRYLPSVKIKRQTRKGAI